MAGRAGAILLVESSTGPGSPLASALAAYPTTVATSTQDALRMIEREAFDVVFAERARRPSDPSGLALLHRCRTLRPSCKRILIADYDELAELLRIKSDGAFHRVIPKPVHAEGARRIIRAALDPEAALRDAVEQSAPRSSDAEELLRWTTSRLARIPGVALRGPARDAPHHQLQLVMAANEELACIRRELSAHWGSALKARGMPRRSADSRHPVMRMLWPMAPGDEVYTRPAGDGAHTYVALLPWHRQDKLTVALGRVGRNEMPALVESLHRQAREDLVELHVPDVAPPSRGAPVVAVPEYDWVLTRSYAGPDRRERPTTLLNRFALVGRRWYVPPSFRSPAERFVDRLMPVVVGCAALYLILSATDAALSVCLIRRGALHELNPVLRPLLTLHPLVFLVAKNALALGALFLVSRYQLLRVGHYALAGVLAGYAALDAYWIWLLIHLVPRLPLFGLSGA